MAYIDTRTESLKQTGQRAGNRDCERRRKDLKIEAKGAETNESVEIENYVTWIC